MAGQLDSGKVSAVMLGSVPLKNAQTVFTRLSTSLPGRLRSIPDGESGERHYFCRWQFHVFPTEVLMKRPDLPHTDEAPKDNYTIDSLKGTGYDDAALDSYAEFIKLRQQGTIASNVRFQICVPTPFAVIVDLCQPELRENLEPLYEQRFRQSIQRIVDTIPHDDLIIQWDLPFETLVLEYDNGAFTSPPLDMWFNPVPEGLMARLQRTISTVPLSVPIAFHLCYGNRENKHIYEPKDTSLMVEFTHRIVETLGRTHHIDYVHMPVPVDRNDVEYVQALKGLRLQDHTRLCLGLVHAHDEVGTRRRVELARSVYPSFDVATECGLGTTPLGDVDSIFSILEKVTVPAK